MASDDAVSFAKSPEKIELCVSIRDRELATSGKACAKSNDDGSGVQLIFSIKAVAYVWNSCHKKNRMLKHTVAFVILRL